MDKDLRTWWDDIKDRDPLDPLTQLEIMREKAEREGCGVSHQYNVIRRALLEQQQEIEDQSEARGLSGGSGGVEP